MPNPKRDTLKKKVIEFERVGPGPTPTVYANSIGIRVTPWDFAFQLGTISEATKERMKVQENLCVYMSPQHTKAFSKVLTKQIELYEREFGAIPEPRNPIIEAEKKRVVTKR